MLKQRLIFITGIIVALLPYSGFPVTWKNTMFVFFGILLIFLGYLLYREKKLLMPRQKNRESFVENTDILPPHSI